MRKGLVLALCVYKSQQPMNLRGLGSNGRDVGDDIFSDNFVCVTGSKLSLRVARTNGNPTRCVAIIINGRKHVSQHCAVDLKVRFHAGIV